MSIRKRSEEYDYTLLAFYPQIYYSSTEGSIQISGYFRQQDTFNSYLAPSRRYLMVYLLSTKIQHKIVAYKQLLDYKDATDWHFRQNTITKLKPEHLYRITFGRRRHGKLIGKSRLNGVKFVFFQKSHNINSIV